MADRIQRYQSEEQSQTMGAPYRLPLIPIEQNREFSSSVDARLINAYAELDPVTNLFWIKKRYGFGGVALTPPTAGVKAYGTFVWTMNSGMIVYANSSGVFFSNGTTVLLSGISTPVSFEEVLIAGGTQRLLMDIGSAAYVVTTAGVPTQITDADFPSGRADGWVTLDGTTYRMTALGAIYGSDINDPTSWTATNVIQANAIPGYGTKLVRQLNYVVAIKSNSIEVFYNAGNATGSPLSRVDGALKQVGCGISGSVAVCADAVLFIATQNPSESGGPRIAMLKNLELTYVSTPPIERLLEAFINTSYVLASYLAYGGHRFYVLTGVNSGGISGGANTTLAYDLDQDVWSIWNSPTGTYLNMVYFLTGVVSTVSTTPKLYGQAYDTGAIHIMGTAAERSTDNGTVANVDIYTPPFDGAVDRRKLLSMLRINADQIASCAVQVRWSDDDYQNWSAFRTVDLSKIRPFLANLGTFYRRAFHFRCSTATDFRMKSVDLQLDVGNL